MPKRLLLALLLAAAPATALAHHGWSSYDADKVITHKAVLSDVTWGNPHGTAKVHYRNKVWNVILAPTSRMEARVLAPATLLHRLSVRHLGSRLKDSESLMRI